MSSIKSFLKSDISKFLIKVICIYFVWYLAYELWILPNGYIDEPLSKNIASISAGILTFLGEDVFYYGRVVGIVGTAGGEIVNGCNGIAAIGLFSRVYLCLSRCLDAKNFLLHFRCCDDLSCECYENCYSIIHTVLLAPGI